MDEKIEIKEVTEFSSDVADVIRTLAQQEGHNYKELTDDDFKEILSSPHTTLFVAEVNGQIAGMITLVVTRIPYARKASLEDLVVNEEFRGRGLGTLLVERVIEEAKKKKASYIDFTSRPRREGSNALYEKLGFQKRETNVYRHILDYNEL